MCGSYCRGCDHYRGSHGFMMCEYLLDNGHRRPCPPGKDCTCHTSKKPAKIDEAPRQKAHRKIKATWNQRVVPDEAVAMVAAGKTDAEIAAVFHMKSESFKTWRLRHGVKRKPQPIG